MPKVFSKNLFERTVQQAYLVNPEGLQKAIPYDIPGAEYSHYGEECTFDFIVKKHNIKDEVIHDIAKIVRGADTHRFELAEQAAELWAISAGLSANYKNDLEQLEIGMKLYDALYSWAKYAKGERHTWNSEL